MGIGETAVGEALSPLVKPPITLDQLIRCAKASGDYNPIHVDEEAAHRVGLDSVIAHGMLSMAFLGQFISQQIAAISGAQLHHFQVRFSSMVRLGDVLTCHGIVKERRAEQGREFTTIECWVQNQKGEVVGGPVDAETLMAYCRERLANYKTPSAIEFIEALPRNALGKIDKKELRKQHVH